MTSALPSADLSAADTLAGPHDEKETDGVVQLSEFERALAGARLTEATNLFLKLTSYLAKARGNTGLLAPKPSDEKRRAFYTRLAAGITTLVNVPAFALNEMQVAQLCAAKPTLEAVFELSGFDGPDHLLQIHGSVGGGGIQLNARQAFFISLFYSLDRLPPELMEGVLKLEPNLLLMLALGWLSAPAVLTEQGEANRRALLNAHERIGAANGQLLHHLVLPLAAAWMHCSYADSPNKHLVKKALNQIWLRVAATEGLRANSRARRIVDKPILLVLPERMQNGHAMHRSYAACIRQLRQRFHTVCLAPEIYFSEDTRELFDEVQLFGKGAQIGSIGSYIVRIKPDVIYYPSLGMTEWTLATGNLRYAPIQVMTLGHPAPAMNDTIDYTLVQAGMGHAARECGTKVIERKAWGSFVPHQDIEHENISHARVDDGALHIAINSSKMKLSARFLAVCERLQAEARRPLHFHFFASVAGVAYDRTETMLRARFKNMTLHPSRRYGLFLEHLAKCDLALAAFPFGNTNSTVDTCLLGIPNIAFFADEVLSIGDRDVMRLAGLPEWLVATDDEGYFQAAMRLIHDDEERLKLGDYLRSVDLRARFFKPPQEEDASEFVDAMWWIYQNHEKLQASSSHILKVGDSIPA